MNQQVQDCITIKNLELYCHHGVLKEENVLGQRFVISAKLYMDLHKAGETDDIHDSVNYAEVAHYMKECMEEKSFCLIEAAAERLADGILRRYPAIKRVSLELKKPWAPILLPLETVSVQVERSWHTVCLALGSNMGNRKEHLDEAVEALRKEDSIRVLRVSEWIETDPVGYVEQDKFLNGAVLISTIATPYQLLDILHRIEKEGKRERSIHWGPRTIDIDILLYDDLVMDEEDLMIPHKEMHRRGFVLTPLAQIQPYAMHPVLHQSVMEMLGGLE